MKKTIGAAASLILAAGALGACDLVRPQPVLPICAHVLTLEPADEGYCVNSATGYRWVEEDDSDFDLLKRKKSSYQKQNAPVPPVVRQPSVPRPPAKVPTKPGTGGMGRK